MSESTTVRWARDSDGIVVLTLSHPARSVNIINTDYVESMAATVERLEAERDTIAGVVITLGDETASAGGGLNEFASATADDAARITNHANRIKSQLRRLETLGRPVVAAINGSALGRGLEIALAAHYRIVADVSGTVLGLPEVSVGLLPGGGGVIRTVRLLGIERALSDVLMKGQRFGAAVAQELGLVDEVVDSIVDLLPAAKAWIAANPDAKQPWDIPGYTIPGGDPSDPAFAPALPALPALLRKQLNGAPAPAPRAILAAAVEGAQVDIDTASLIETRYFVHLVTGQVSKNMIKANFDLQTINSGGSRPRGFETFAATKVGVIGAGMMGAGIAYVTAKAGIQVVLKDVSIEAARTGKAYAERLEAKALANGATTNERSKAVLELITPTDSAADFAGVDFVVEAVFENVELKHSVFKEIQDVVNSDAVLGSNTSSLPITALAEAVDRRSDFIGIHFFSPVDKMPLVEIITGQHTSAQTLSKVVDYTLQIGKTPIVVNDSRGFFTSRVILTFLGEALAALGEGVDPAVIEQAGSQAGYPAPPLQLLDELTLTLPRKVRGEARAAVEGSGGTWAEHDSDTVLAAMIDKYDRKGRSTGSGFYNYDESGRRTTLWPGLREAFGTGTTEIPFHDIQERMLFAEAIETIRCFDEGVLTSVADANVGSLFGIGYPAWTGGVLQYINGYPAGLPGFVDRADELAERYGKQFTPPESLIAKAASGGTYQ
jgi:3-hydroxyacyl-CoA dehydrogenase/enoyl-CoA hydratase/3-hydroxybutyryl-CoA epimerase